MSKANQTGRSILRPPQWTQIILSTMDNPAWRALSTTAQALYPWLRLEWHGPTANNNGSIRLSVRQAAARMGVTLNTAAKAFHELQAKGFIVQTEAPCLGIDGAAKAPAFELTEIKMFGAIGDGRKLFRQWSPENEFPVAATRTNNPEGRNGKEKPCLKNEDGTVSKTKTDQRAAVSNSKTGRLKNDDENGLFDTDPVLKTKTSLSHHTQSEPVASGQLTGHTELSGLEAKDIRPTLHKVQVEGRSHEDPEHKISRATDATAA